MDYEKIITDIFGKEVFEELSVTYTDDAKPVLENVIQKIEGHIIKVLTNLNVPDNDRDNFADGRLGPKLVGFDTTLNQGLFIVSPDRLHLSAQSNFSSVRANAAVYHGKWMYEVQLVTAGVMQIGWSTLQCKFNQEQGVGDTINSYAYDGNRVRKWNISTHKYGNHWVSGDIISTTIDLDEGKIGFYRNGRDLGIAFDKVSTGLGFAYFPSVSLAFSESLSANFGNLPLHYSIEGYKPLQQCPNTECLIAFTLVDWLEKLLNQLQVFDDVADKIFEHEQVLSCKAFLLCLARCLLNHISQVINNSYVVVIVFVPFFTRLSNRENLIYRCLDLMWTFLQDEEVKCCIESSLMYLSSAFQQVSLDIDYARHRENLKLLNCFCQHLETRNFLLQDCFFDKFKFVNFLHVKPIDEECLKNIVNQGWWETNPINETVEVNKVNYLNAIEKIKSSTSEVEALQVELLIKLMDNTERSATSPTSRAIFLKKLRQTILGNLVINRIPLPVALCCVHRLLVTFKILWDSEIGRKPIYIPCKSFCDSSINFTGIDRLGGEYSYLKKTFYSELTELLGLDITIETEDDSLPSPRHSNIVTIGIEDASGESSLARMLNLSSVNLGASSLLQRIGYFPLNRDINIPISPGPLNSENSLLELLDGIILFYNVAGKKQISKVARLRDVMAEYVNALADIETRMKKLSEDGEMSELVKSQFEATVEIFEKKLSEQSLTMAWVQAVVFSEEKQSHLVWLLQTVITTLANTSSEGNLFSFVPDFYLDVLSDLTTAIKNQIHPTISFEQVENFSSILRDIGIFLCDHYLDPRIVNANSKDTLVLTLAGFASFGITLKALESVPEDLRIKFVTNLLKPYENKAWAQANWILVRFWQGDGFAFRYDKSPHQMRKFGPKLLHQESASQTLKPCPSEIFQRHIGDLLLKNQQQTVLFLNSLLNQLNWAFSEFIGMIQEIHNVSSRPERVYIESRQLKICATCFDLTIFLLRVIEMITATATLVFTDPNSTSSENLLTRLCQLICQILNRVSLQSSSFQHVLILDIPDLQVIDHFPILSAVVGILLALLQGEIGASYNEFEEVPRITRTLISEASFQMNSLHFLMGNVSDEKVVDGTKSVTPFSFENYKSEVSESELQKVKNLIGHLDRCQLKLPVTETTYSDDDLCTICYACPAVIIFKPCNHQSCRACIERHVLNNKNCFFCKTTIKQLVTNSGDILNEFLSDQSSLGDSLESDA